MAKMARPDELRTWNDHELQVEMQKIERELFDLRAQSSTEKIKAPSEIWLRKKQVARIKTILRERSGPGGRQGTAPTEAPTEG
jgi:large subunit ribosomal protein L29